MADAFKTTKEQVAVMKPSRMIGIALSAVFALGVVAVSGAQAESAPYFSIGGTRLAAGKTHDIAAHAIKTFEIVAPATGIEIPCTKLTVEKGVLLGSEPGNEGKTNEVSKFEGCSLVSGNGAPNCHLAATEGGEVSTTITTNPLRSELVENVEGGRSGKKLEELYSPASGSVFETIDFGGTGCEITATKVTGKRAAEVVTDPSETNIELGTITTENSSFITRYPESRITEVWLVTGGTGKIVKVEEVFFGNVSTLHGTALTNLSNSKFEPETTKWSPLP